MANEKIIKQALQHDHTTKIMSWLPPYHDMGLIAGILQALYLGTQSVLTSPITFLKHPMIWLKLIAKYKIETSGGPNFAYKLCLKRLRADLNVDLSSWTVAANGAEPVQANVIEDFSKAYEKFNFSPKTFLPCYGLAEATLFTTAIDKGTIPTIIAINHDQYQQKVIELDDSDSAKRLVSCGKPYEELQIVNPDTRELCLQDQVGEIWVHGDSVAQGYWQKPELNKEIFQATIKNTPHEKFYLRTGDLGFMHNGELYVSGRLKDLIIIDGINYYPQDIEHCIEEQFSEIRHGCIAAFSLNKTMGEQLYVVAEARHENLAFDKIVGAIKSYVFHNIGAPLTRVIFIKNHTIPKTTSGKIRRAQTKIDYLNDRLTIIAQG